MTLKIGKKKKWGGGKVKAERNICCYLSKVFLLCDHSGILLPKEENELI